MKFKKHSLLLLFSIPLFTVGCNKNDIEEIEVVDEFLLAEDDETVKEKDNSNDEVKEDVVEEKEDINKIDIKIDKSSKKDTTDKKNDVKTEQKANTVDKTNVDSIEKKDSSENKEVNNLVFEKSDIPESIKNKMIGKSMPSDSTIDFSELSYLRISYVDFNGKTQVGEMVVNKVLAQEVLDIFKELYDKKYPIEKMKLIDEYNAVDEHSMSDNNTSAFCYRVIAGTSKVSNHGKGVAIDINPLLNPHVVNGVTNPPSASKYKDRTLNEKGMITKGDDAYNAFIKRGWRWGGSWNNPDYQHFEKTI